MTLDYDIPPPHEGNRKDPHSREPELYEGQIPSEPLLYDDLTRKLTKEGKRHLDEMARLLSREELKYFHDKIEPAAQKYLRRKHLLF